MPELLRDASRRVVGARQVLRAVEAGNAERVFIARDADPFITQPVVNACEKSGVRFEEVATMQQLGKDCAIGVNAAVAGILKA